MDNKPFRRLALLLLLAFSAAARGQGHAWRGLEGLPSGDVRDLVTTAPDQLWAATGAGLCLIERHSITVLGPPGSPDRLAPATAPAGAVYARYPEGIALVNVEGFAWVERTELPRRAPPGPAVEGVPASVRVTAVFSGEVWAATDEGLWRRRLEPWFRRYRIPGTRRVNALAVGPDGTIWCGTERGVGRVNLDRDEFELTSEIAGRQLGTVTGVAVDREGRVWICSGSSFTGVYRRGPDGWEHLDAIDSYVHGISLDPSGALWFAVLNPAGGSITEGRGAWYFSEGRFREAPVNVELPSGRVYDVVARDPAGVLWFATLKGLAAYDGRGRVTFYKREPGGLQDAKVWCLCAARDGSLWVGYQRGHGVSRLARGRITHYGVADGLCDANVWAIAEGRAGVFWIAGETGLSRFDGRRWSCFREEEGLGGGAIWPLLPLPDGTLWIGTLGEGLVHLVPGDDDAPRTRFPAESHRVARGEKVTVRWQGTDAWFETPATQLWYRRRLDDGRWSAASPARSAELGPLEPGRHTLYVQAIDRFGNAEDPPASITIDIEGRRGLLWPAAAAIALLCAVALIARRRRRGS